MAPFRARTISIRAFYEAREALEAARVFNLEYVPFCIDMALRMVAGAPLVRGANT